MSTGRTKPRSAGERRSDYDVQSSVLLIHSIQSRICQKSRSTQLTRKEKERTFLTMTAPIRKRLEETRLALLTLHKALLDSERITYEHTVGPIQSPNHFLQ